MQLMNYRKNGDAFVNYLSVTPIHDSAGVLTHYVGIQSDITDLVNHKKAELAAKHAAVQVRAFLCISCPVDLVVHLLSTYGTLICQLRTRMVVWNEVPRQASEAGSKPADRLLWLCISCGI